MDTFIIAELSANHNGSLEKALKTVEAAKEIGADAIKIQTYTADTITLDCKTDDFKIKGGLWDGYYLYDLYKKAYTPWEWHKQIFDLAKELDLVCFSSPFDKSAVDFLEGLNNPIYKIASFEITDIPLIKYAASKGKPMIISTGISCDKDIDLAVEACRSVGNNDITLLKCTSAYPAPISEANLVMIKDLSKRYNVKSGLSDHSLGITLPVVAVAIGATVIEKHFILDKSIGGPDSDFSLDKQEFAEMIKAVREAEKAVGEIDYQLSDKQKKSREHSRSLYISEDVKRGDFLTDKNIKSIRPNFGLHPKHYDEIIGKKAKKDLQKGTPISWNDIM